MTRHDHASDAAIADLGPADERGTPDAHLVTCDCGVVFRRGSWHRCEHMGERVDWEAFDA